MPNHTIFSILDTICSYFFVRMFSFVCMFEFLFDSIKEIIFNSITEAMPKLFDT